jgi:hypothetical protein
VLLGSGKLRTNVVFGKECLLVSSAIESESFFLTNCGSTKSLSVSFEQQKKSSQLLFFGDNPITRNQ